MIQISDDCRKRVESLPESLAVNKAMAARILELDRSTVYDYLDGIMNYLSPSQRPHGWDWKGERNEPLSKNCLRILFVLKTANDSANNRIYAITNLKKLAKEYFDELHQRQAA